jgi:hypothetical protein
MAKVYNKDYVISPREMFKARKLGDKGDKEGYSRDLFIKYLNTCAKAFTKKNFIYYLEYAISTNEGWGKIDWQEVINIIETFPYPESFGPRNKLIKQILSKLPPGIKETENKIKEIAKNAIKLKSEKLKLENWAQGTDRTKGSNQVTDPGNSYGQYEIDDIIQPPHRLKKKKGKKVKLPHPGIEYPPRYYMENAYTTISTPKSPYLYIVSSIEWALKTYPINPWNAIFNIVEGNMRYLKSTKEMDKLYDKIKKINKEDKENVKESLLKRLKDYAHPIASAEEQSKKIRDTSIKLPAKKLKLEAIEMLEGWANGIENSSKRYNSDEEDDEDEFEKLSRELYYQGNTHPYKKRKKIGGDIPEVKLGPKKKKLYRKLTSRGKEIYGDELVGRQAKKLKEDVVLRFTPSSFRKYFKDIVRGGWTASLSDRLDWFRYSLEFEWKNFDYEIAQKIIEEYFDKKLSTAKRKSNIETLNIQKKAFLGEIPKGIKETEKANKDIAKNAIKLPYKPLKLEDFMELM